MLEEHRGRGGDSTPYRTVQQEQRRSVWICTALVNEVHPFAPDRSLEVAEFVEFCFPSFPVIPISPVVYEPLQHAQIGTVCPRREDGIAFQEGMRGRGRERK
jgi:hypothetical protein